MILRDRNRKKVPISYLVTMHLNLKFQKSIEECRDEYIDLIMPIVKLCINNIDFRNIFANFSPDELEVNKEKIQKCFNIENLDRHTERIFIDFDLTETVDCA